MIQQMIWLSEEKDGDKILYLRVNLEQPFKPYYHFSQYALPDYNAPGGSRGYRTMQSLLKGNWQLVPSSQIEVPMDFNPANKEAA